MSTNEFDIAARRRGTMKPENTAEMEECGACGCWHIPGVCPAEEGTVPLVQGPAEDA